LRSRVATFAHGKIVATKSSFPVVTRHATERTRRSVMIERLRRAHVSSACLDPVTLVTTQPFRAIVFCMTETNTKRGRRLRCTCVTFHRVADAAGGNITTVRLRTWRVTAKTICVRVEACGYRQRDSST
jgi:hypothetical protein